MRTSEYVGLSLDLRSVRLAEAAPRDYLLGDEGFKQGLVGGQLGQLLILYRGGGGGDVR